MKFFLVGVIYLNFVFAEIPSWNSDPLEDKYGHHYVQHKDSVSAARKSVTERLQRLGADDQYLSQISAGSNNHLIAGDTTSDAGYIDPLCTIHCERSRLQNADVDNYGVGYVGYPSSDSSNYHKSSSQQISQSSRTAAATPIIIPSSGGSESSYRSTSSHSERSTQQAATPIVVPVAGGESERYSSRSEHVSERKTAPAALIPVSYPSTQSQRYSSHAEHVSEDNVGSSVPIRIQVRPSSVSNRYVSQAAHVSESQQTPQYVPVATYPSGSRASERYQSQAERVSTAQTIPIHIQAYPTDEQSERYASSRSEHVSRTKAVPSTESQVYADDFEHTAATPARRVPYYTPISRNDRLYSGADSSSSNRLTSSYPVYAYPAGSRSRYESEHKSEHETSRSSNPQPIIIHTPAQSTSSRYTSASQQSRTENVQQPQYIPVVAAPARSSSSRYVAQSDLYKSNAADGRTAAYVPIPYRGSSSRYYDQQNQLDARHESDLGQVAQVSTANDFDRIGSGSRSANDFDRIGSGSRLASRHGSSISDSGLSHFISESERLAELQSKTVRGEGSALVGSAILETEADRNSAYNQNQLDSQGSGSPYRKTKSWEKSSKWSSGTAYDDTGKLKTYGSLSTGESEHHNINGHQTGYKAATTTLDDDGKVSTYSIHTP